MVLLLISCIDCFASVDLHPAITDSTICGVWEGVVPGQLTIYRMNISSVTNGLLALALYPDDCFIYNLKFVQVTSSNLVLRFADSKGDQIEITGSGVSSKDFGAMECIVKPDLSSVSKVPPEVSFIKHGPAGGYVTALNRLSELAKRSINKNSRSK